MKNKEVFENMGVYKKTSCYYYCNVDDKEYILLGDEKGKIRECVSTCNIGDIIIKVVDNLDNIIDTLNKYINILKKEKEDISDDRIFSYLSAFREELNNNNVDYLSITDITKHIERKYTLKNKTLSLYRISISELQKMLRDIQNIFSRLIQRYAERIVNKSNNLDYNVFNEMIFFQQTYINSIYKSLSNIKVGVIADGKIYLDDIVAKQYNSPVDFSTDLTMIETYSFHSLSELVILSLMKLMDKKIIIKNCVNCGKYFIPESRSDEKYCNRISPKNPNKTCKEFGVKKTYREEIKNKPLQNEHIKTTQFFRMRMNRAKEENIKTLYENRMNEYKAAYALKNKAYKVGKLDEETFLKWIIEQKQDIK